MLVSESHRAIGAHEVMNHIAPAPARLLRFVLFVLIAVPPPGLAQRRTPDLGQMSIEDLLVWRF